MNLTNFDMDAYKSTTVAKSEKDILIKSHITMMQTVTPG